MSEVKKITDEELSSVKGLREEIIGVISTVGQLKLTHDLMEEDLTSVKSKLADEITKYKNLLSKEKELLFCLLLNFNFSKVKLNLFV